MSGRIIVSREALRHNARALRALVAPAQCSFVVKSNAYGHGLVETARAIAQEADAFCVYALDEALALRESGITNPVIVLGPVEPARLSEAIAANFGIPLWDRGAYLRDLRRAADAVQRRARIHVKVETGISRLGIAHAGAAAAIAEYAQIPQLQLDGVFSHLAAAEELDSPFTITQLERLQQAVDAAQPALRASDQRPRVHIAASAAAMLWPQTRLDLVRAGIALYGLWPSDETRIAMNGHAFDLRPALAFETALVAIRPIAAGTPVGYGSTYHAPRATRIGVLPVGYADGIPRLLSNRGAVAVGGKRVPIAGRICMNMTMVDLGAAAQAAPGDTVTLIGESGGASVGAEEWARWSESIAYEIVTRLPAEIPRVFV